ncbi:MAG: hypothetical protein QOJ01_1898 [Solirubrobacterales bacterium]|nr:hypothetical protein [Solirubrobacterales bacterium]
MLYVDLLRITVLLAGGVATALAGVAVVAANQDANETALIVAAAWWVASGVLGAYLGGARRTADSISRILAGARTAKLLPAMSPGRIALKRLWPIGAFAVACGGISWLYPQVPVIGAGYALGVALAWRRREAAVTAIEERDGVRFYVEPGSAFSALELVRSPGLGRDRAPVGHLD